MIFHGYVKEPDGIQIWMNVFVIARPGEIFWEGTTNKTKHQKQEFMHMKRQKMVWSYPNFKIWLTVDSRNLFESYWIREFHLWILNLLPKSLQNAMNFGILIQDSWLPIALRFQERSRNSSAPSMVPVSWSIYGKINGKSMVNQWQINGDWFIMVDIYGISMIHLLNMIFMWQTQWINCIKRIILYPSDDDPPKRPGNDQTTLRRISGWPAFAAHLGAVTSQLLPWPTVGKSPHIKSARWYRLCLVFYMTVFKFWPAIQWMYGMSILLHWFFFPFMAIFHIHHCRYFPANDTSI